MSKRTLMIIIATIPAVLALFAATAVANDDDVERQGTCTGATEAEIKLSPENGRIETEFEVDQNRNGVTWRVVLRHNGKVAARTQGTTAGRSGSFEIRRVLANRPGTDTVSARAVSPSGEVCTASVSASF